MKQYSKEEINPETGDVIHRTEHRWSNHARQALTKFKKGKADLGLTLNGSSFQHGEAFVYYSVIILAALVCAIIGSSFLRWAFAPSITANMRAYVLMAQAAKSVRIADKKDCADEAYATADDPDIRKVADWCSRVYSLPLNSGVETQTQSDSLIGATKVVLTLLQNPTAGVDFVDLIGEYLFGGVKKSAAQCDARYLPIFRRIGRAQVLSSYAFWLIVFVTGPIYYRYRGPVRAWLQPRIRRIRFIRPTATETQTKC